MANKTTGRPKSDQEVLSLLSDTIASGSKFLDTKLAKERQRVMDYYNGKLPAPQHAGNSKYVSTDVYDTVESLKANLLETFSAGNEIVQFSPDGAGSVELAKNATAYTEHVIFELNGGTELFNSIIHDGLTARVGIAKVYWDEQIDEIEEEFEQLTEDELDMILSDDSVEILELGDDTIVPQIPTYYGTLVRKVDNSQIRIDAIPAEEFIVNPAIKSLKGEDVTHRTETTRADLKAEGYDPKKVDALSSADNDELDMDQERLTRFDALGGDLGDDGKREDKNTETIVIYETYTTADLDGSGRRKFWRILHDNNKVVLERELVERHPFIIYTPIPIPHSFFGVNLAEKVIPIQNSKTVLTRSILDHAVVANNPKMGVVRGALTNPREMLDNRIGGVVNLTRSDGIFPLPQAPLNPYVFQTIQMLDDDKEDATGVSRLSQGLNKDAVSSQNSQGMIEQLISASMVRQKAAARAFANQFLRELYIEVYRLGCEKESKERMVEIAGNWVGLNPSDWPKLRTVSINFRLGYGERDRMAGELLDIHTMIASDPEVQHLYKADKRFNVYRRVLETKGFHDVVNFIDDPETAEPPQPDPMMVHQMEMEKAELALKERKMTLDEQKAAATQQLETMKDDYERRFRTLEHMLSLREADRKDAEVENRIEVSQIEMDLAKKTVENPNTESKASAIVSPNG